MLILTLISLGGIIKDGGNMLSTVLFMATSVAFIMLGFQNE